MRVPFGDACADPEQLTQPTLLEVFASTPRPVVFYLGTFRESGRARRRSSVVHTNGLPE